ncbi:hypothetical protein CNYM01_10897 [Colletotrichum nymphaeae SA-01]|uniref:Uncharacterized protein n=1 Tax=Colletotrichum nymphaeae SA-01 TaxID=1460502 RepID=A0A135TAL7_9PEZI|nr:hypothetical protein CNYM01_10897 [Colletotrichum nymphaeae SA-01]
MDTKGIILWKQVVELSTGEWCTTSSCREPLKAEEPLPRPPRPPSYFKTRPNDGNACALSSPPYTHSHHSAASFSPSKEDPESETKRPPPILPQGPKTRLSRPARAPNCNGTTGPPPTWCTLGLGAGEWDPKNSVEFAFGRRLSISAVYLLRRAPVPRNGRDKGPRDVPCSWGLGFQSSPDTRPGMAALQPSEGVKLRHGGKDVLVLRRASGVILCVRRDNGHVRCPTMEMA